MTRADLVALQPVAMAVTQVFGFYAANVGEFEPIEVLRPLLISSAVIFAVWGLASWSFGDTRRGALFASVVALLFWSSSSIAAAVDGAVGSGLSSFVVAGLWLVGLTVLFVWLYRSTRSLTALHWVFNVVAAVGVGIPLATITLAAGVSVDVPLATLEQLRRADDPRRRPDIYLIVLDAHARDDDLAEHFGAEFRMGEELEKLGFYVARESRANYSTTLHALPALLNFQYLPQLIQNSTKAKLKVLTQASHFVRILKRRGYRFISYASGLGVTECRKADVYLEPPVRLELFGVRVALNYFERGLLLWTPFEETLRRSQVLSPYVQHRERILYALRDLPRHAADPAATFVFAHILSPHEPFVFGEHGEDVSPYDVDLRLNRIFEDPNQPEEAGRVGPEYARRYREQARYVDGLVRQAVEEILDNSPEPPVILILGDHGPYGFSPDIRQARMPILNAFYLPYGGEESLYPAITPVNSLRVVLNHYFGWRLPMLPDRSYRTSWSRPNEYQPVVAQ